MRRFASRPSKAMEKQPDAEQRHRLADALKYQHAFLAGRYLLPYPNGRTLGAEAKSHRLKRLNGERQQSCA